MCIIIYLNDVAKIYIMHFPQFPPDQENDKTTFIWDTWTTNISLLTKYRWTVEIV